MEYVIKKNKRSKSIRISVNGNGEVVVTMPYRLPKYFAERFVESKRDWINEKVGEMKNKPQKLLAHYSAKDFKEHKERARELVNERIEHFNKFYNLDFKNIVIRNQKTRWGSCSGKKNLNFNYKIIFLPSELADYLIVHELCHLAQMNHGPKFWSLVAEQIPEYKERRKQLCLY